MDNLENQIPVSTSTSSPTQADFSRLQEQHEALRHLVVSILILLIAGSGTFTIYLLRQVKYTRAELQAFRPQATNVIAQYQKNSGPAIDSFVAKVTEYGRTHSDFAPIMTKYGIKPSTSNAPAATVAPGAKK